MPKKKKTYVETSAQLLSLCDEVIKSHEATLEERLQTEMRATENYKDLMEKKKAAKNKSSTRRKKLLDKARKQVTDKEIQNKKRARARKAKS